MKVLSLYQDDDVQVRAHGDVRIIQRGDVRGLVVPTTNETRYLIVVEDGDIGTLQSLLKILMDEDDRKD